MAAGAPAGPNAPNGSGGAHDDTPAPAALLRLREGDVVRLCGLIAAAHGLDYIAHHAVGRPRREGARLLANLPTALDSQADESDATQPTCEVWAELIEPPDADRVTSRAQGKPIALRWGCSVHASPSSQRLGCEHVAALLTAWLRAPGDFRSTTALPPQPLAPAIPHAESQTTANSSTTPQRDAPFTLAGELGRLNARDACELAERLARVLTPPENIAHPPTFDDANAARRFIEATLTDAQALRMALTRLEPGARATFNDLMLMGGTITAGDLATLQERAGRFPSDGQRDLLILERFGLVFRAFQPLASSPTPSSTSTPQLHQIAGWRIAPELRACAPVALLPAPVSQAPEEQMRQSAQPSGRRALASPRQLCLALALLARAPAPLGPFGAPYAQRDHAQMSERQAKTDARMQTPGASPLAPGDLPQAQLTRLARAAGLTPGLARMARRILLWGREQAPGQPLTDLASAPLDERALALRAGFDLWRGAFSAVDLLDLTDGEAPEGGVTRMRYDVRHPAFRPAALAGEAAAAREFVVGLLTHAQPNIWYRLDDLLALIWRIHPLFLRGRQQTYAPPVWLLERIADGRPLRPTVREEWLASEGVYIRALLAGPLHWWGALDLAFDAAPPRRLSHIRLTRFGAFLLAPSPTPIDIAQANQEISDRWGEALLTTRDGALAVHPLAVSAAQLEGLARWGRPVRIAGGRLLYALSADLAAAAFDQGLEPDDAVRMLSARGYVAETLLNRLRPWRASYGAARIESGWALIEARDEPTLREALAAAPEIAARARLLSPTQALLRPDDLATLRAALTRRGMAL